MALSVHLTRDGRTIDCLLIAVLTLQPTFKILLLGNRCLLPQRGKSQVRLGAPGPRTAALSHLRRTFLNHHRFAKSPSANPGLSDQTMRASHQAVLGLDFQLGPARKAAHRSPHNRH